MALGRCIWFTRRYHAKFRYIFSLSSLNYCDSALWIRHILSLQNSRRESYCRYLDYSFWLFLIYDLSLLPYWRCACIWSYSDSMGRQLTNPIHWIIYGFNTGGPKLYLAIASLLAFALNLYLVFNKKYPEALFMFICLVLPLSSSLNAMPRYLFGLYPTFLGLAMIVERYPSVKTPLLCVFSAASCFISIGFFSHIMFTV